MLDVNQQISIPLKEFEFSFSRSPGPGGQNVNKLNTKVLMRWKVAETTHLKETVKQRFLEKYQRRITKEGEILVTSSRFRDQGRNVGDALYKLKQMILEVAPEPKRRKKKKRSAASNRKRLENKRLRSEKKRKRKDPKID